MFLSGSRLVVSHCRSQAALGIHCGRPPGPHREIAMRRKGLRSPSPVRLRQTDACRCSRFGGRLVRSKSPRRSPSAEGSFTRASGKGAATRAREAARPAGDASSALIDWRSGKRRLRVVPRERGSASSIRPGGTASSGQTGNASAFDAQARTPSSRSHWRF